MGWSQVVRVSLTLARAKGNFSKGIWKGSQNDERDHAYSNSEIRRNISVIENVWTLERYSDNILDL